MGGLSKLGIALTTIFVVALVALAAELFYVLWRRRVFHRQAPCPHLHPTMQLTSNSPQTLSSPHSSSATSTSSFSSYSKELIYFYLCLSTTRVEPNSVLPGLNSTGSGCPGIHEEVIDVFKLQNMCGPSRFLFTIKEDGDRESDSDREKRSNNISKRSLNLDECLLAATAGDEDGSSATVLAVNEVTGSLSVEIDHQETPFSTPCQSPFYFTPSSSPIHHEETPNP